MVIPKGIKVVWSYRAKIDLRLAWEYIAKDSPTNAKKVVYAITAATNDLIENPTRHPPDKYRKDNRGDFHAFEIHQYRISYQVTKAQIKIVRLRHVKKKPLQY